MGAVFAGKAGRRAPRLVLGALLVGAALPAAAQTGGELPPMSRGMVQPLPDRSSIELNAALTRLASNPRDLGALLAAGNAALKLGDTDAALGFFARADQIAPGNPWVKSALARAMVKREDPFGAIPLFEAAERAGANDPSLAADRGLAYDLVGDNVTAQRFYRQAQASSSDPEIVRRLAISLAMAGDRKGAEAVLAPQLQRNDRGGWRAQAFVLAILGEAEEAVRIAYGTMPREMADGMAPYLRYMPRLTPAQQAAAANFGHFPRAAQIGRDDPRVVQYAAANPRPPRPDAGLVSQGKALGGKAKSAAAATRKARASRRDQDRQTRIAVATPRVPRAAVPAAAAPRQGASAIAPATVPPSTVASQPLATLPAPAAQPPVRIAAATIAPPTVATPPLAAPPVTAAAQAAVGPTTAPALALPTGPGSVTAPPAAAASQHRVPAPALSLPAAGITMPAVQPTSPPPAASSAGTGAPLALRAGVPASNLDIARAAQQGATGAPLAPSATTTTPPETDKLDLAAAFSGFRPPADEQAAPSVAVDISKIAPARARQAQPAEDRGPAPGAPAATRRTVTEPAATPTARKDTKAPAAKSDKTAKADAAAKADKAKPAAKPAAPSHPSRIWVQIGVGRDKSALAFDWRKATRQAAELVKGKKAWTTPWGATNRLLVGPFESQAAAQAFLKGWKDKDSGAFVWTSPAGQAVDALVVK